MHQVVVAGAGRIRSGTHSDEDARRGLGRREEALAPEGHRPRASGFDPLAAVGRAAAWRTVRSRATTTMRVNKKMKQAARCARR